MDIGAISEDAPNASTDTFDLRKAASGEGQERGRSRMGAEMRYSDLGGFFTRQFQCVCVSFFVVAYTGLTTGFVLRV